MIEQIQYFIPEIFLSVVALILLGVDAFVDRRIKPWVLGISILSLLIAILLVVFSWMEGRAFGMAVSDSFASFFKLLALISCVLVFLLSEKDETLMGRHCGSFSALVILSIVGIMLLCSSEDFLMVFIGLELTTIPLFILAGYLRKDLKSSEGAIKFFLMGAFSTGLTLYGISLIYGVCGSTHFNGIAEWYQSAAGGNHALFLLGILFLLVGLGFKMTLVPFHQWTPDAYEGAPTPITAFFSVSREAGIIVVFLRFFGGFVHPASAGLVEFFAVLSILTMTIGNLTALRQDNLKRLLAYSSIAHAGTLFIGIVAGNQLGREGVMLYSVAYSFMSLGAFAVVIAISRIRGSDHILAIQGLAKNNLSLAFIMLFFLLSLAGIPPTLGFWGKFYVFSSAIQANMIGLVAIGLINSVISVYYYFRIAHKMFFQEPVADGEFSGRGDLENKLTPGISLQVVSMGSAALIILLGTFPQGLLALIKTSAHLLP